MATVVMATVTTISVMDRPSRRRRLQSEVAFMSNFDMSEKSGSNTPTATNNTHIPHPRIRAGNRTFSAACARSEARRIVAVGHLIQRPRQVASPFGGPEDRGLCAGHKPGALQGIAPMRSVGDAGESPRATGPVRAKRGNRRPAVPGSPRWVAFPGQPRPASAVPTHCRSARRSDRRPAARGTRRPDRRTAPERQQRRAAPEPADR